MDLKEYLQSLSKENLISLLMDLSDSNAAVKKYLTEKQNSLQTQPVQNIMSSVTTDALCNQTNFINRQSSPQEKINLFKTLFSGRQDVFALRWFNAKSNKSGYSPVCGNKWLSGKCDLKKYSCTTCPYKLPVALSDNYFYNHLAGKDEFCRDVIGLYPLMEGNLCKFLAMDFDAHAPKAQMSITSSHANGAIATYSHAQKDPISWKEDILAIQKSFSDFGINSYLEISRSGNGGHLWIFFEETISSRLARNLGSAIIKAAMQKRHSISFESFDRFFPNQDEIPKGGYGNLIALPLQGKAVKEGHSVFV
ncbi:MAG: type III restriction endonuclease subunit R, partial [Treponema sp.]|nr:type III restriction endonuclease subunit R [Treponema sp.]